MTVARIGRSPTSSTSVFIMMERFRSLGIQRWPHHSSRDVPLMLVLLGAAVASLGITNTKNLEERQVLSQPVESRPGHRSRYCCSFTWPFYCDSHHLLQTRGLNASEVVNRTSPAHEWASNRQNVISDYGGDSDCCQNNHVRPPQCS